MKVGVIGSGTMGTGIAQVALLAGSEVYIYDTNAEALSRTKLKLNDDLIKLEAKAKIPAGSVSGFLEKLHTIDKLALFNEAEIIIEAIVENLEVKKNLFVELESIVSVDCILTSNTSSLSITSIAGTIKSPERVIGIHFFNPAPLMKLVEIIPAIQTDLSVLEKVNALIKSWGKTTVLAKDTPGFIVNRIARPYYSESIRILEEGIADVATIDFVMTELAGFKMGPFTLMDFIGHDVNYSVTESVWTACYYEARYKPSFTQKRLVEAGYLGRKSGRGFYRYTPERIAQIPTIGPNWGDIIVMRILSVLINEAADALYFQIASEEDIDLAMTTGVNYPKGLLAWGKEIGFHKIKEKLDQLYNIYHEERYRSSPGLSSL